MKKFFLFILMTIFLGMPVFALEEGSVSSTINKTSKVQVFSVKNRFGLKDDKDNIIVKPQYSKLVALGNNSYIVQKKSRFGIIDKNGTFLVKPRFRHAERYFGKFAKLGNYSDYGVYNQFGNVIIPPEYTEIDPLFGKMFLTCKNYKYGIMSFEGKILLKNEFDNIYMPNKNIMRIQYEGQWFEVERITGADIVLPEGVKKITVEDKDYKVTAMVADAGLISSYSVVSATNYLLKVFSSISPAYEQTIDELMFSQGAEGVNVFIKLTWLPRFPFTYAYKYYTNLKAPNNGPLGSVKTNLKRQIK